MTDAVELGPVIRLEGGEVSLYAPNATAALVCMFDEKASGRRCGSR